MRKGRLFLAGVAALVGLFVAGGPARAQGFRPVYRPAYRTVDSLAQRLEGQARELLREFRTHFGRSPRFRYLERDILEMARLADHVHDVAHRGGSLAHLRSDVNTLDRLFHRVERQVDELCVLVRLDPRGTAHLRAELARLGRTLHQLRREIN